MLLCPDCCGFPFQETLVNHIPFSGQILLDINAFICICTYTYKNKNMYMNQMGSLAAGSETLLFQTSGKIRRIMKQCTGGFIIFFKNPNRKVLYIL